MNSKKIKDIKIIAIIYIITIAILAVLVLAYHTGDPLTDKERDALGDALYGSKSSSSLNKNTYILYKLPSSCKSFYEFSMGDCLGCEFERKKDIKRKKCMRDKILRFQITGVFENIFNDIFNNIKYWFRRKFYIR